MEQLLIKTDDLKQIIEIPSLYLSNYFNELRNEVDLECLKKQKQYEERNQENKTKINEIWKEMITKIDSFEKQCINNTIKDHQQVINRLESIELMLNNNEFNTNLEEIKETIEREETNCLQELFQNKTIVFIQDDEKIVEFKNNLLINGKLVILNDFFIKNTFLKEAR